MLLEEYSFPKHTVDIDSCAADLLAAASDETQAAFAASMEATEAYAARVTCLEQQLQAARADGTGSAALDQETQLRSQNEVEDNSAGANLPGQDKEECSWCYQKHPRMWC